MTVSMLMSRRRHRAQPKRGVYVVRSRFSPVIGEAGFSTDLARFSLGSSRFSAAKRPLSEPLKCVARKPEMDNFTPIDTMDANNFLRAVTSATSPTTSIGDLHFLMPVTGFENDGKSVTPAGFDKDYGLFLTIDGTSLGTVPGGPATSFANLNFTLWADPLNNDGSPSVSETSDPAFSNGMTNDIVLATGTMVSASMSFDPTTMLRTADFVDSMTPTLAGTVLLDGSIKTGDLLEVKANTPSDTFASYPQSDGSVINTVDGGTATITLDPQGTILVPNLTHGQLQLADIPRFLHGSSKGHHGSDCGDH
jgi:hypothetical protein